MPSSFTPTYLEQQHAGARQAGGQAQGISDEGTVHRRECLSLEVMMSHAFWQKSMPEVVTLLEGSPPKEEEAL